MTALVVVGVDPGGRHTGVVVRRGDELLYAETVERLAGSDRARWAVWCATLVIQAGADSLRPGLVAVEDVRQPNPHVRLTNVAALLDTAAVVGAMGYAYPRVVLVPPGEHGRGPAAAYPAELIPARGLGRGHDWLRHVRSAWDVAGAAPALRRLEASGEGVVRLRG